MQRRRSSYRSRWAPYVPVARRRQQAARAVTERLAAGKPLRPVRPARTGRALTTTFWGRSWCENLERYSDFANRLPRGRSYLRNGSVIHLEVEPGKVSALVSGSSIYEVTIGIGELPPGAWRAICRDCTGEVASLVELLQGRLSTAVMARLCLPELGMFPAPAHITMRCSCPDWATMCKHVAAVMYGVGVRLDEEPGLLFVLRRVDHLELVAAGAKGLTVEATGPLDEALADSDLGAMFGIELDAAPAPAKREPAAKPPRAVKKKQASRDPWITAQELRNRLVPQSVVQSWLRKGLLTHSGERGIYVRTAASEALIAEYLAAKAGRRPKE